MNSRPRPANSYRSRITGTALLTACALTVTATTGCGLALRKSAQKAVRVAAEEVLGQTLAPFFDSVGEDREGMRSQDGGLTSGARPGLYAAAPSVPACDRGKLAGLLTQDPAKAAEWARIQGITPAEIGPFLARTTPVLLGSDTLVRNHRFENGVAVGYPALLQAGTAVLVDPWGRPVAKCGCGNPLTQLAPVPAVFEPQDMAAAWRHDYRSSSVVAVTAADAPLTRFDLLDATAPDRLVVRPTGTAGEADTTNAAPPPAPQEEEPTGGTTPTPPRSTTTTRTTPPRTSATTPTRTSATTPTRTAATTPTRTGTGTTTRTTAPPTPTGGPTRSGPTEPTRPPAAPALTLSQSYVRVGDTYTARATGFAPGEVVRFTWTGPSSGTVDDVTADATGTAVVSVYEGAAPGDYRIHATGTTSNRTAAAPLLVV